MRRFIFFLLAVAALAGGGYLFLFKRAETVRAAKGYKHADTPQISADMFKRAIENRDYDMAAYYCTADYAEQLRRGNTAAAELGGALDDLHYQMKERGLVRDEVKLTFHFLDPFPKEVQITVGKEKDDQCEAVLVFAQPTPTSSTATSGQWKLAPEIFQAYTRSMKFVNGTTVTVPMKKVNGEWKFDFAVDATLQARVGYLNDKYKNYTNPLKLTRDEVKNDPTTKENVTSRIKSLLEKAATE